MSAERPTVAGVPAETAGPLSAHAPAGPGTPPPGVLYVKAEKAHLELRQREFALSPRMRQMLILVDGRRDTAQLARMLPDVPLDSWLAQLERDGFIVRLPPVDAALAPASRGWEPLPAVRERVSRALLDAVGPIGDDMAARIARCLSVDELREVLPAALSVCEAVGGQPATQAFLQRAGRI